MTTYEESLDGAIGYFDNCFRTLKAGTSSVRVLDFGCGSGQMVRKLRALGYDDYGCDAWTQLRAERPPKMLICWKSALIPIACLITMERSISSLARAYLSTHKTRSKLSGDLPH